MNYRPLGRTGWKVSEISFGAWAIGGSWGQVSDQDAIAALHQTIDCGVNFIDTADVYGGGRSERLISIHRTASNRRKPGSFHLRLSRIMPLVPLELPRIKIKQHRKSPLRSVRPLPPGYSINHKILAIQPFEHPNLA